MAPTATRC